MYYILSNCQDHTGIITFKIYSGQKLKSSRDVGTRGQSYPSPQILLDKVNPISISGELVGADYAPRIFEHSYGPEYIPMTY